jgi:hypothetical protein
MRSSTSTFFPVGRDCEAVVAEWIDELVAKGFGPDNPLFPATRIALGENRRFAAVGLDRKHWRDAGAIRRIFKQAFERAELPNYNPHSFQHTLAVLGEKICRTPEEWKAPEEEVVYLIASLPAGEAAPEPSVPMMMRQTLAGSLPLGA